MTQLFEVSGDWMNACGKGKTPKVFPVLCTQEKACVSIVTLALGNGQTWVVFDKIDGQMV